MIEHTLTYWQYYLIEAGKIILYWELFKYVGKRLCKYTAKIWRIDRILRELKLIMPDVNSEYYCNTCKTNDTLEVTPHGIICLECGSPEDYTLIEE